MQLVEYAHLRTPNVDRARNEERIEREGVRDFEERELIRHGAIGVETGWWLHVRQNAGKVHSFRAVAW